MKKQMQRSISQAPPIGRHKGIKTPLPYQSDTTTQSIFSPSRVVLFGVAEVVLFGVLSGCKQKKAPAGHTCRRWREAPLRSSKNSGARYCESDWR